MAFRLRYIESDDVGTRGDIDADIDDIDERHDEILVSMSQDSLDVDCDDNFELSIIEDMEPFSLEQCTHTQLHTAIPVTPPSNEKPTVEVHIDGTLDSPPHQINKRQKTVHCSERQNYAFMQNGPYTYNLSYREEDRGPNLQYYRSLKKLANSMRQSEETRLVVMHHRQLLLGVYGKLETENSLLSGLGYGATLDFLQSRNDLMEMTCDAIEQPRVCQRHSYN